MGRTDDDRTVKKTQIVLERVGDGAGRHDGAFDGHAFFNQGIDVRRRGGHTQVSAALTKA
jgi:hypothetical protein